MRKIQSIYNSSRGEESQSFDKRIITVSTDRLIKIPESVNKLSIGMDNREESIGGVATASHDSDSPWPRYMSLTGAHGCAPICERGVLPCTVDGESGSSWSWLVDLLPERWTAEDGRTDDN